MNTKYLIIRCILENSLLLNLCLQLPEIWYIIYLKDNRDNKIQLNQFPTCLFYIAEYIY